MNNLIIAHRGIYNNKKIPENSLLAFKKALDNNLSIELDIQMTKDNKIVVFHDNNLERMTKINNTISNMTYNEIKNLYLLSTSEKIPLLEDVLKLVNDKVLLLLDIKPDRRYKEIVDNLIFLLNKYNNYQIESFANKIIMYLKRKYPLINRGIILSNKKNRFYKYIIHYINIKISQVNFISISKKLVNNKKYINLINKHQVLIWTIKDKDELDKYLNKYYGYICDNLPYKKS